jgi:hypothetical protein
MGLKLDLQQRVKMDDRDQEKFCMEIVNHI